MRLIRWRRCKQRLGLAGRAGPRSRPLARHKQSPGLFVSGLGLSHRLRSARRAEGAELAYGGQPRGDKCHNTVRRGAWVQLACGSTHCCPSGQRTRTAVPLHLASCARQRTLEPRCQGSSGAETEKPVSRWHHAHRHATPGVHATPRRAGSAPAAPPDPLSRGARPACEAARCDRAAGGAPDERTRARARPRPSGKRRG